MRCSEGEIPPASSADSRETMTVLKTLLQDPPLPEPEQILPELGFIEGFRELCYAEAIW